MSFRNAAITFFVLMVGLFAFKNQLKKGAYQLISSFEGFYLPSHHQQNRWQHFQKFRTTENDIVFFGDSLIELGEWSEFFPEQRVRNRGVGGMKISDLLHKKDFLNSLQAKKLILQIGINDLWHGKSADEVFEDYKNLLESLRVEQIVVTSVLPVNRKELRATERQIRILNAKLKSFCRGRQIPFIEVHAQLLEGERIAPPFSHDGVHLTPEGYAIWAEVLRPHL